MTRYFDCRLKDNYKINIGLQSDNGVLLSPGQHGDVFTQHGSRQQVYIQDD